VTTAGSAAFSWVYGLAGERPGSSPDCIIVCRIRADAKELTSMEDTEDTGAGV
jgi:hypothetical protein